MKKLWSVCLVIFLVLGAVLLSVSAAEVNPGVKEVKVVLSDGIGLKFVFNGLAPYQEYSVSLDSSNESSAVVATIRANASGEAFVEYNNLNPSNLEMAVTATLVDYPHVTRTASVKQYCDWALNNMALSDEVHALVADLLEYAVAAKNYLNPANPTESFLTNEQKELTSVVPVRLKNFKETGDQGDMVVQWTGASPILGESVAYRFRFTVTDPAILNGLNFTVTMGGRTYEITGYKQDGTGCYVDFTSLNPANLLEDVVMVAKNADGEEISVSKIISLDRYTSKVRSDSSIEKFDELCDLVNATLAYQKGALAYVQSGKQYYSDTKRDITSGALTDAEIYRLSSISLAEYDGKAFNGAFAEAIYNKAGLSVDGAALNGVNVSKVYNALSSTYAGLLVEGSLGGTTPGSSSFLAKNDFEIGDLLYAYVPISGDNNPEVNASYWTALYLGNGKFLLETRDSSDMEIDYADLKSYLVEGNKAIADENDNAEDDQVATVGKAKYYFALRPSLKAKETQGTPSNTVTRAEMENALKQTLWAYYTKGEWAQYESTTFNAISYTHGGYSPLGNHLNTLEDATEQNTLYSVCSNFAWCAYYEALGYPLFGNYLNPASAYLWIFADEVAADAEGDTLCVMRWHNYPCDDKPDSTYWDYDDEDKNSDHITHVNCLCSKHGDGKNFNQTAAHAEMVKFFEEYEKNLRPGDIIRLPGHVVVYAGDGWILEAGGSKYNKEFGFDGVESDGVINATRIEQYFHILEYKDSSDNASFNLYKFNRGKYGTSWDVDERNLAGICVLRPLNLLTTDDGDGKVSDNDILNLDYYNDGVKYNYTYKDEETEEEKVGVKDLTWQLEHDTVEIPHTGYNIIPSAYTRMFYPLMNINRTVNIGAYGTAVKGGTITYTVEIRNQSNDAKYTYENKNASKDYIDVPITETIPANVAFVSASEGYVLKNGVLYWEIDVPAGETRSVSYTVRVTGEMGAQIVNDGGFVGTIPSNTLVNTIGGQNLSSSVEDAFLAFYEAGKDMWNDNSGYKISASIKQDGSVFAEQLYRVAGLDLDLPELEELLKVLFSREYIEIPRGGFHGYDKSAASWMLTLNDTTADAEDQIWRDMIINGRYFGGNYVWTNNFDKETRRVSIPRTSDLQPGDFIIGMDISYIGDEVYAYKVTDWKVIFYLGNDQYASLTSDGVLTACDGPRELIGSIVWDVFIGMRPSQAYADINESLFSGTVASLTDADIAWETPKPSTVGLNKSYRDIIASMVLADTDKGTSAWEINGQAVSDYGISFAGKVYSLAGLDINTRALSGLSYKALMHLLFNDLPSDSEFYATYAHEYHKLDQAVYGYENIYNMLMFYDGEAYVDKNPLSEMSQLQVGDVIVLGRQIGKITQVMIYQGSGNFLISTESPIGGYYLSEFNRPRTFANDAALLSYLNGHILNLNKNDEVVRGGVNWEGYMVLRPARGFENINTRTSGSRDVADRMLTAEEELLLSRIKSDEWGNGDGNLAKGSKWFYSNAKIDVTAYINGSVNDVQLKLNNNDATYMQMLVPGSRSKDGALKLADYQIGDLFCGRYSLDGGNKYWTALYQGNGRFLITTNGKECFALIFTDDNPIDKCKAWVYYYVLRPNQLAPAICGENLTWELNEDGTLTISGTGAMYDFAEGKAPWRNYRERIQSVVIDAGVTSIGQNAFYGCTNLTDVNYGGTKAQWKAMEIGSGNEYLLNAVVYATDGTIVAYGTCGDNLTWELDGEGTLTISGTGEMYNGNAPWYEKRDAIKTVVIENGATNIGDYAFYGCTNLTDISIPNSVTVIGAGAFGECSSLITITIPNSVTNIGESAFYGCTGLADVSYGGTKAQWKAMEIGSGNESLLNAVVYATDGTIVAYGTCGDNLTWELDGEGTLTISGTGTMYSFAENGAPWYGYSSAIQNVALGENVTSIGDYAFNGFSIPTSITIPTSVTTIGEGAFNGCTGLKDVYYGDTKAQWNKISIGTGNECLTNASLHTVTPSGACGENLTWVLNDDGTLIITGTGPMDNFAEGNAPWYAYRDTIKKVLIKNGATNIGEYAFYGCSNLTDITIPNSVTVIGTAAFADCTSLADVTCGATMVQWQDVTVGENNECLKNATFHFTIVREPIEVELPEWV